MKGFICAFCLVFFLSSSIHSKVPILYRYYGDVQIKEANEQFRHVVHKEGISLSLDDSLFVGNNSKIEIAYNKTIISIGQCATTVREILSKTKGNSLFEKMWEYLFQGDKSVFREYVGHKGPNPRIGFSINMNTAQIRLGPGEVFYIDITNEEDYPVCVALLWQYVNGEYGVINLITDSSTNYPYVEIIPPQSSVRYYQKNSDSSTPGFERALLVIEDNYLFDPFSCLTSDNGLVDLNCFRDISVQIE